MIRVQSQQQIKTENKRAPKIMSNYHELPTEVIPSEEELQAYEGLKNIRYRKDSRLIAGLFMRLKDHATVVTISAPESKTPFVFPVKPEDANPAFEHPYGFAPKAGKLILQDILESPGIATA